MAIVPAPELIIAELERSFDRAKLKPAERKRFARRELSLRKQQEFIGRGVEGIFQALEFDKEAREAANFNILNAMEAYAAIEQRTWTFGASSRQVLWEHLVHLYVPGAARLAANWVIASRPDEGMPDGRFWFLPEPHTDRENSTLLRMPVAQVVDWLLDLLERSVERLAEHYAIQEAADPDDVGTEGMIRALYRWRNGKYLPDRESIARFFPDEAPPEFSGALILDKGSSADERFDMAQAFAHRRKLDPDRLWFEINLERGAIGAALSGEAGPALRALFTERMARRYSVPSMKLVRQRLLFARACQDGYRRLVKSLCPATDPACADPTQNRVLELIDIFKLIYNLTIEAHEKCGDSSFEEMDDWFEQRLPPQFRAGLFWSIMPSMKIEGVTNHDMVAERLSRILAEADESGDLRPYAPCDRKKLLHVFKREVELCKDLQKRHEDHDCYRKRLDESRALSDIAGETRPWFLNGLAGDRSLPTNLRQAAAARLKHVAKGTSFEIFGTLSQIDEALANSEKDRVEALLEEARALSSADDWRPVLLRLEARHLIKCGEFRKAQRLLRIAWKASREGSFGRMRGEIARDLFALDMSLGKFNPKNHGSLYRDMVAYGLIQGVPPGADKVSDDMRTWFETYLYERYRADNRAGET